MAGLGAVACVLSWGCHEAFSKHLVGPVLGLERNLTCTPPAGALHLQGQGLPFQWGNRAGPTHKLR